MDVAYESLCGSKRLTSRHVSHSQNDDNAQQQRNAFDVFNNQNVQNHDASQLEDQMQANGDVRTFFQPKDCPARRKLK
jgi:hypothetical protein